MRVSRGSSPSANATNAITAPPNSTSVAPSRSASGPAMTKPSGSSPSENIQS